MSSMDEPTLEFLVRYSLGGSPAQEAAVVSLLEPHRDSIEQMMSSDFDPDEHSWRGYAEGLWSGYYEKHKPAILAILAEARK